MDKTQGPGLKELNYVTAEINIVGCNISLKVASVIASRKSPGNIRVIILNCTKHCSSEWNQWTPGETLLNFQWYLETLLKDHDPIMPHTAKAQSRLLLGQTTSRKNTQRLIKEVQ